MKTLSIEVRRARPQDARLVAEVHRQAWMHAYSGLIPHKALIRMVERRGEAWWRRAADGPSTLLVAEVAGAMAGYVSYGANRVSALPQEGEIYELYLLPQYQGLGLGGLLFREARDSLKSLGLSGLIAWCLEDSVNADQFFRARGGLDVVEGVEDFDGKALRKIGFVFAN